MTLTHVVVPVAVSNEGVFQQYSYVVVSVEGEVDQVCLGVKVLVSYAERLRYGFLDGKGDLGYGNHGSQVVTGDGVEIAVGYWASELGGWQC